MAKEWAKKFYNSRAWLCCRRAYIDYRIGIDGGLCETCHSRLGEIVHHKKWLTPDNIDDPNITLDFGNLKYDCQICHNKEKEEGEVLRYVFDDTGQVIPVAPPKSTGGG